MCGLCAISRAEGRSSFSDGHRAIISALLAIEERGPDSTGVAWTRGKAQKVWYHKLTGPASKVARHLDVGGRARIHTFIGHGRWASQGAVNEVNAHPVVADNIVLIHNGTIRHDTELVELSGMRRVGTVDSWAIAALIARSEELGVAHVTELLELIEGTAAIAWLDADDPASLHLARIKGSPMTIAATHRGDFIMSSTRATLTATARMAGVELVDVQSVPEGTYLRVVAGRIVEHKPFGVQPDPKPTTKSSRSYMHGVTDAYYRDADWWSEAERLLGDGAGAFRQRDDGFEWNEADPWRRPK